MRIFEYKPFRGISGFLLEKNNCGIPKFLYFKGNVRTSFSLKIKKNGYVPKSGLIICNSIHQYVSGKKILEIGTGETAVISIFCSKHGSSRITAIDIDKNTINWAKINCKRNRIKNIKFSVSDIYEKINGKYDTIISNPPQLPETDGGSPHDFGGRDGRSILEKIIINSSSHLNKNGCLFLLIFDFLGVNAKYGQKESLFELLKNKGFQPSIVCSKTHIIRRDGKTYESMNKIKQFYPKFTFGKNSNEDLTHKIFIVKAMKLT